MESSELNPFALISDEIRAKIIKALGDARVEKGTKPILTFTELMNRTAVDIPSSQFNYHLQRLQGIFVDRVDGGYQMRVEGRIVYHALRSGTLDRPDVDYKYTLDTGCYYCGQPMEAVFENSVARIRCTDCNHLYEIIGTPPALDPTGTDPVTQFERYCRQMQFAFANRSCRTCGDRTTINVLRPPQIPFNTDSRGVASIYSSCPSCGDQFFLSAGELILYDEGVVSFCHDRGLDVLNQPVWTIPFAATDRSVVVSNEAPLILTVRIELAGETLLVRVDNSAEIIERIRS